MKTSWFNGLACSMVVLFLLPVCVTKAQQKIDAAIEKKVDALLKQMSLEEKVGQMAQVSIESLGGTKDNVFTFSDKMKDAVVNYKIGSILNTPGLQTAADWNRIVAEIQDAAKQTKLKIPVLYGLDDIHGVNYVAGAAAIVNIFLPGNFGGDALADILTGTVNPGGKLPITYPRYANDLVGYIHKPSEGSGNPQGGETAPQYPFGFGLSYTSFSYSDLTIDKNSYDPGAVATISVKVTNTGNKTGKEVVQLFVSDVVASLTPDVKRLRAFEKIELKAGESQTVTFTLVLKDLAFVGADLKKHLEAGAFTIQTGDLKKSFTINKTLVF
jgi:hypothetical protein